MIDKLLTAVAPSLVSGLFGLRKPKAQGIDYQKLRRDAEAAGFNPLTALLAGGGAGYQRDFNPALASGAFVGEALQRGLDTYFNTPDPADLEAERLRERVQAETFYEMQKDSMLPGNFGYSLSSVQPFRAQRTAHTAPLASSSTKPGSDPAKSDEGLDPPTRPITLLGMPLRPSGLFSDAESTETRYAEVGSNVSGTLAYASDIPYSVGRLLSDRRARILRENGATVFKIGDKWYLPSDYRHQLRGGGPLKPIYGWGLPKLARYQPESPPWR